MPRTEAKEQPEQLVLEIDRTFDAPRELVWRLWSDPEHMVRWHGPEGIWLTHCEMDFRVGGHWRRCMSRAPGHAHWISGTYLEIEPPRRLRFSYINAGDGFETVVTMDFLATDDGRTRMLFRQTPFLNVAERDGHSSGWRSGFDVFDRYVSLFIDEDWRPRGAPRSDGVAEDIVAARLRQVEDKKNADVADNR